VTGSSLTGFWGERPEAVSRWLLERSAVHVLASDAHDAKRRIPKLSSARAAAEKIVGAEYADALVEGNPGAIVKGLRFLLARGRWWNRRVGLLQINSMPATPIGESWLLRGRVVCRWFRGRLRIACGGRAERGHGAFGLSR